MLFIREGATHKVVVGPFVDVGDGFTPETGVTLSGADEAEAILHDNGTVVDISGYTWAAITTADGYYHLTLQAGISNTIGHLTIVVQDDSVCLPVKADFTVLPTEIYDALFASDADGFDASGQVNVGSWIGTAVTLGNGAPDVNVASLDDIDLSTTMKASVNTEVDNALDTAIPGVPTANSVNERVAALDDLLQSGGSGDAAAILTDTGTTIPALLPAALVNGRMDSTVDATGMESGATDAIRDAIVDKQIDDSVPADGTLPTIEQALYMITQFLYERAVSGTTVTVKKADGSTTLLTLTLDDGTSPTSITRAT